MSVPHLDKRIVDGHDYLLFGPFATFSTRLLKRGKLSDFFTTLRWHNLHILLAAIGQNLTLVRYLVAELFAPRRKKFAQLLRFYPNARPDQWELVLAGQRAQLVTPDKDHIGALRSGTELVVAADGTIAGLLGASPGASTAVPIMLGLLQRCFPEQWQSSWRARLDEAIPAHALDKHWSSTEVADSFHVTAGALSLGGAA
jgi:malate dehydrogenase (quinone)